MTNFTEKCRTVSYPESDLSNLTISEEEDQDEIEDEMERMTVAALYILLEEASSGDKVTEFTRTWAGSKNGKRPNVERDHAGTDVKYL
ncbi:hypothetical protein SARC_03561, partial [Sphaeroforma arctica JP610]